MVTVWAVLVEPTLVFAKAKEPDVIVAIPSSLRVTVFDQAELAVTLS